MSTPIKIDGSLMEGGGQLLRVAVALSAVTGKPIHVEKIRSRREKPGLRHQHLAAVNAVAELVSAEVTGLEIGSQALSFRPGRMKATDYRVDVGTAGSTTLILQALMPALAFAPSSVVVTLTGGTNNPLAPSIDYMTSVLLPALKQMGYSPQVELLRRGFYPRGGGEVRVKSEPVSSLTPLRLSQPETVNRTRIFAYSCKLPNHIASRMISTASDILRTSGYSEIETEVDPLQSEDSRCSLDPGCGLLVAVEYASGVVAGFDGLGERGRPAEKVAQGVVEKTLKHLKIRSPVEPYLCDQLIVWMSIATGHSELQTSQLTLHALTCIEIARRILGVEFEVKGKQGEAATIRCEGASLKNEPARRSSLP